MNLNKIIIQLTCSSSAPAAGIPPTGHPPHHHPRMMTPLAPREPTARSLWPSATQESSAAPGRAAP
jgi:hypothetical protein